MNGKQDMIKLFSNTSPIQQHSASRNSHGYRRAKSFNPSTITTANELPQKWCPQHSCTETARMTQGKKGIERKMEEGEHQEMQSGIKLTA